MVRKKVLMLGATGRVGPGFVEEYFKNYNSDYELIIGIHKSSGNYKGLKTRKFNLSDINSLKKTFKGIDVIIYLAAQSNPEADFGDVFEPNIIGSYNVFEAARQMKVKRIVFASSVHAIRGYPFGKKVKHSDVPLPKNLYGASKVWGENLCYIYSKEYKMSCLAIRIGAYVPDEMKKTVCNERENYDYVITQRDMAQLIQKCVIANSEVKFGILSGISDNSKKYMDLKFTKKLVNYRPQDNAHKMCKQIKREGKFFWQR